MANLQHPRSFPFLTLRESLLLGIAVLGILLRFVQFLANRSLWLDECFMALNLRAKSFTELLLALDNDQAAPIGFLLTEKAAVQVLGDSEYALRLFPLLAGIASILLFWRLGRYCLRPNALLLALGLFAISGPLIYYSSEVKQYSGDVAVALLVYLIAVAQLRRDRWDLGSVALLSLGGGLAIWFSHPVIFVLAGIAVTVGTTLIVARRRSEAIHVGAVGVVWILSFAANYLINLRSLTANSRLSDYWQAVFVPFPPRSFAEIRWLSYSVFDVFVDPGGFTLYGLATLCFLAGCVSLFSRHKTQLFLFLSPLMFALVASGAGKYPFEGRLLLFVVPSLLIITADGAEEMRFRLWERSRWLGISLLCLLLYHPLLQAKDHLIEPRVREEMRSVLGYVRRNWKDGDTLYLSFDSQWAFRYYAPKVGLGDVDPVVGDCCGDGRQDCAGELEFLQGRNRVWVVFSHLTEPDAIRIKDLTMNRLDRLGARSKAVSAPGAEAYLFDFGRGKEQWSTPPE